MKKIFLLFVVLITASCYGQGGPYATDRILVKFRQSPALRQSGPQFYLSFGSSRADLLNEKYDCRTAVNVFPSHEKDQLPPALQDVYVLHFQSDQNIPEVLQEYLATGLFEYAEPDYHIYAQGMEGTAATPNDQHFGRQWGLFNNGSLNSSAKSGADIKMKAAWDITTGDSSVIVCIIDTGLKLDHPEFSGRIWKNTKEIPGNGVDDDNNGYRDDVHGWNFVGNNNNVMDDNNHGTNVTSIIGANGNNAIGYAGVDWKCKLMTIKVLNSSGNGSVSAQATAIRYATDQGARVINMSLGGSSSATVQNAVNYAHSKNVLIVAAMGNRNTSSPDYPAAYTHVMAVGSTSADDTRTVPFGGGSGGSNYGDHISVVAPGNIIYGCYYSSNTDYSRYHNGTSQATPHVVGLASLLLAQNKNLTPDQLRQIIEKTADDRVGRANEDVAGFDRYMGWGRINALKALTYIPTMLENEEAVQEKAVSLFPNPFSVSARIVLNRAQNYAGKMKIISIRDVLGREVLTITGYDLEFELKRYGFNNGIYYYNVHIDGKSIASDKFVVTGE